MEKKLPQIKIREWNEKPRTKFRFIKIGDIFCYQFSEEMFVFGQILGKVNVGHVIQFFDIFQASPTGVVDHQRHAVVMRGLGKALNIEHGKGVIAYSLTIGRNVLSPMTNPIANKTKC